MTTTWICWSCGKRTDGRSGMDDAMDCFCDRCPRCGGLTDVPSEGDGCQCPEADDEYDVDDDIEPVRSCANCGCTDDRACEGGCWWATEELCSECVPEAGNR